MKRIHALIDQNHSAYYKHKSLSGDFFYLNNDHLMKYAPDDVYLK